MNTTTIEDLSGVCRAASQSRRIANTSSSNKSWSSWLYCNGVNIWQAERVQV